MKYMAVRMNYAITPLAGHMAQHLDMQLGRVAMAPISRKPNLVKVSAASGDESREVKFEHMVTKQRNGSNVETIILAGGAGSRLFPLTQIRAKPAVPIAGSYRLIDVPISNCLNSGLKKIYVMTQYCSASLNRHVSSAYNFSNNVSFGNGFVEILAATQTPGEGGMNWFQGTADAVRQFDWLLKDPEAKQIQDILILSGDHLYQMDYMEFIETHRRSCADITISCLPMDDRRASDFGLMKIDGRGRVIYFSEKPKGDALKAMEVDTTVLGLSRKEAYKKPYIASMGIYVFKKDVLLDLLRRKCPTASDFGSEVIPASAKEFLVKAFLFDGYWEDIGTIRSFYEANLSLTDDDPKFSFYNEANTMYTSRRSLPPSMINNCKITNAIVSDGCILHNCSIERCVIGLQSVIGANVFLKDTVMFGADFYESNEERARLLAEGKIPIGIGSDTTICNCILDKNVRVGRGVRISNSEGIREAGCSDGFYIKDGIVVIPKNSIIKDGLVV